MQHLRILSISVVLGLCAGSGIAQEIKRASGRPFRLGIIKFDQKWDATKPLAAADPAGWTTVENLLVGQARLGVAAAYSVERQKFLWQKNVGSDMTAPPLGVGATAIMAFRDGRLQKVKAQDGGVLWEVKLGSFVNRAMTIRDNLVVAVTGDQHVYGLDVESGQTRWLHDAGRKEGLNLLPSAPPVVLGDQVVIGLADGAIRGLNLQDGQQAWNLDPAVAPERFRDYIGVIMPIGSDFLAARADGVVARISIEGNRAKLKWQARFPELTSTGFRDRHYYLGTKGGDVISIDPEDNGKQLWRAVTGTPVAFLPTVERSVLAIGANGRVTALEPSEGSVQWFDDVGGDISVPPMIRNDELMVATGMRVIYLYRL